MKVHDIDGRVDYINNMLLSKGFEVYINYKDPPKFTLFKNSKNNFDFPENNEPLYMFYCTKTLVSI